MIHAARCAQTRIVSALLQAGADPNLAGGTGVTPLLIAAKGNAEQGAALLLERGANPNEAHNAPYTPMAMALRNGKQRSAARLRERGARK